MNPKHIAQVGIRLVAIYLIAQGLSAIYSAYMVMSSFIQYSDEQSFIFLAMLFAVLSPGIIGILLWFIAPKLSGYFLSETNVTTETQTKHELSNIQSMVMVLIGVYIVAVNIPNAVSVTYYLFTNTVEVNGVDAFDTKTLISAISNNLKLLLGVTLIVGSNLITNLIARLRTMGTNSEKL